VIVRIQLNPHEVCLEKDCGFAEGCAGKKKTRDSDFTCDLEKLKRLFSK